MKIVTIEHIPGVQIEVVGLVKGTSVRAKHIGKDIVAGFKGILGGEVAEYTEMIEESRKQAITEMIKDAKEKNCDAIVGMKMETSQVASGMSEITVYGTGVIYL